MKAKIGDNEFCAEGDDAAVSESFQKWLDMIRHRERLKLEARIGELEAELSVRRHALKCLDEKRCPTSPSS